MRIIFKIHPPIILALLSLHDAWWGAKAECSSSQPLGTEPDPPLLVLSSDKSRCFDSGGPLNGIHGSPFTPA